MKKKIQILIKYKLKELFFYFKLHLFIPQKFLLLLSHLAEVSKWISNNKKNGMNDFYSIKRNYNKRYELYDYILKHEVINGNIDYLEFGVANGNSFKWWLNRIKDEQSRFYGFDTFTGLPEKWGPYNIGDMKPKAEVPEFHDKRSILINGLFQKSLNEFLNKYDLKRKKIIHMDADLYSSTSYVLHSLTPYIGRGDIIIFDEFNVPMHEFKAFSEWTKINYIEYEVIASVNNFFQVAIKVK
ncbi:MAG: class I SAM-dependent methyltransferase [Ignavibacteria bacterium]